jgi:uncharacterized repeat protein (TIGR01451 family)
MKKTAITAMILVLTAFVSASASTGTALINPVRLAPTAYHPVITITYKPPAGTAFDTGAVAVQLNHSFYPEPSTVTTSGGQVTAVIMVNGQSPMNVDPSQITIDGFAVTINSISLGAADSLVITYGAGTSGIYGPGQAGEYPFIISEKDSSTVSDFTPLDSQPFIIVTNMTINKTCSSDMIEAGNTVTYYLSYNNYDTGNNMTNVSVTDTMPAGLTFLSSQPTISSYNGNIYTWNVGSVASVGTGGITVTAKAASGIASYGFTSTNNAVISGTSPASGSNGMSVSDTVNVNGAIMNPSITAAPATVVTGDAITVVMNIQNSGNLAATNISPSFPVLSVTGAAVLSSGPVPANISSISPNNAASFTWVYTAASAGTFYFSNHAYVYDNGQPLMTSVVNSNSVAIVEPSPTSTFIPVYTPTMTETPSASETATATSAVSNPTETSTPTPAATIAVRVLLDRNYINTGNGDTVLIRYKAAKDGDCWIDIYNLNGELVKKFPRVSLKAGENSAVWDGSNNNGQKVGQGIYFIVVHQPGGTATSKLVVIK